MHAASSPLGLRGMNGPRLGRRCWEACPIAANDWILVDYGSRLRVLSAVPGGYHVAVEHATERNIIGEDPAVKSIRNPDDEGKIGWVIADEVPQPVP